MTKHQTRERVLFVTTIPLDEQSGGTRYTSTILDSLSSMFDVQLVVLARHQRISSRGLKWCIAILKALFTGVPPNVIFHSGLIDAAAKTALASRHDWLVIDHLESACALDFQTNPRSVYVSHNLESKLVREKLPRALRGFSKPISVWLEIYERRIARRVSRIISISSEEAGWYRAHNENIAVIHPAFSFTASSVRRPEQDKPLRLGLLGPATWNPNIDAFDLLVSEILPQVPREVQLVVAGRGWESRAGEAGIARHLALHGATLNLLGYVEDISDFWDSVDVLAAPITTGAGVNVKVCEALARRVPVIASAHATRGLNPSVLACPGLVIAHSAREFASAIEEFSPHTYSFESPPDFTQRHVDARISELLGRPVSPVKA